MHDVHLERAYSAVISVMAMNHCKYGKMEIKNTLLQTRKWLMRLAISFMLGFSNALNQDMKTVDDTHFKTEQVEKDKMD
jgi:hypothetical protein